MAPPSVASIFHDAQLSLAKHRKCSDALHALRAKSSDRAAFDDEIFNCVACVLPHFKREASAERVVEFIVHFATKNGGETDIDEEFVERLCLRLLKLAASREKAIRFRVVQLIGRILKSMDEEAEMSEELFDAVESAMMERCRDKVPLVRAWAVKALYRLQNPKEPSDPATVEMLRLMNEDSAKEVRMAAVSTVAPSRASIRAILLRVRDVSDDVRLHALDVLAKKVEMRWLSISQRIHLIEGALRDRTPSVAAKCKDMIVGSWLHKACEGDACALLKALDAVCNPEAADLALEALLSHPDKAATVRAPHTCTCTYGRAHAAATLRRRRQGAPLSRALCAVPAARGQASSVERGAAKWAELNPEVRRTRACACALEGVHARALGVYGHRRAPPVSPRRARTHPRLAGCHLPPRTPREPRCQVGGSHRRGRRGRDLPRADGDV